MLEFTVDHIERLKRYEEGRGLEYKEHSYLDPHFDTEVEISFEPGGSVKSDVTPVLLDFVRTFDIRPSGPMGED